MENAINEERQRMSRREVAKYLNISLGTLQKLEIPCAKVGRRLIYFRDDVTKWLYGQVSVREQKSKKKTAGSPEKTEISTSETAGGNGNERN